MNSRVEKFCDNESVKNMVNNMSSNCMQCMKLIHILVMDNLTRNSRIKVLHVRSKLNVLVGALSRFDYKRFWKNAPVDMNRLPDNNSNSDMATREDLVQLI